MHVIGWRGRGRRPIGGLGAGGGSFLALGLVLLSCPFETRDAVPPAGPPPDAECQYSDALTNAAALRNFEQAFDCTIQGVEIFRQTHAEEFDFNASPIADEDVRSLVDSWEALVPPRDGVVNQFAQHMQGLGGQVPVATISADDGDASSADIGVVFRESPYTLEILENGAPVLTFAGKADIYVRSEGSTHVIYRWDDIDTGDLTMGDFWLRGTSGGP